MATKRELGGSQGRRRRRRDREGEKEKSALICVIVALSAQYGVSLAFVLVGVKGAGLAGFERFFS